jgi:hypothetical protein
MPKKKFVQPAGLHKQELSEAELFYLHVIEQLIKVEFSAEAIDLAHNMIKVSIIDSPKSKDVFVAVLDALKEHADQEDKVRMLGHLKQMHSTFTPHAAYGVHYHPEPADRSQIPVDTLHEYLSQFYGRHYESYADHFLYQFEEEEDGQFYGFGTVEAVDYGFDRDAHGYDHNIPLKTRMEIKALQVLRLDYIYTLTHDKDLTDADKKMLRDFEQGIKKSIKEIKKLYAVFPHKAEALYAVTQSLHRFCLSPSKENHAALKKEMKALGSRRGTLKAIQGLGELFIAYPTIAITTFGFGVLLVGDAIERQYNIYTQRGTARAVGGKSHLASGVSKLTPKRSEEFDRLVELGSKVAHRHRFFQPHQSVDAVLEQHVAEKVDAPKHHLSADDEPLQASLV